MSADVLGPELSEKLSKLNSSQQSIESLSLWCITHRKKAKQIVETWDKFFKSAQRDQRVSFLYLANDILQNSRRKGSEFVNEFWKFLPAAVKLVYDNGSENGKKAASRLVDIWEERKVFGSRGQNLKDEVIGKCNPSASANGRSSNPIKVVKRDAQALRIKLVVGGLPEKIISAFQLVLDEKDSEESAVRKCDSAVSHVKEMEKDVQNSSVSGNGQTSELVDKIQEEENNLMQCVSQLQNSERTRAVLVSQLKEALQDQESKLELIHSKLEIARSQIEQAEHLKQKLKSSPLVASLSVAPNNLVTSMREDDANLPNEQQINSHLLSSIQILSEKKPTEEDSKKAAAAAVVAKLAASTSSAQMLTSVLSSLVAEEAASRSSGLNILGFSSSLPFGSPLKRIKLDNTVPVSDVNHSDLSHSSNFASSHPQSASTILPLEPPFVGMQPPYPQPPPPLPPSAPQQNSHVTLMTGLPYGYGASNLPSPHFQMGYGPPASLPSQQPPPHHIQAQQPQQQQQPSLNDQYYQQPPGFENGMYGQSHQAATSPMPQQ